jgi:hypothetical protein
MKWFVPLLLVVGVLSALGSRAADRMRPNQPGLTKALPTLAAGGTFSCPCTIAPGDCSVVGVTFSVFEESTGWSASPVVEHRTGPASDSAYEFRHSGKEFVSGRRYWLHITAEFDPGDAPAGRKTVTWKYDATNGPLIVKCP